jgi:hypothetical protein
MRSFNQRKSQRQEKYAARDLDGRVQPGSGSCDFAKGDVRVQGKLRLECKTTSKATFRLTLETLRKIRTEAQCQAEEWALQIEFQGQVGRSKKMAIVDRAWFLEMGGTLDLQGPLPSTSAKSLPLSVNGCSLRPLSLEWVVDRRDRPGSSSQSIRIAICQWEEFLDLYRRSHGDSA